MKENLIEYHPNGKIKHEISFWGNGQKLLEQFYDLQGNFHREQGLPDYQSWYENGITYGTNYYIHGIKHNIYNPNYIYFFKNGKIQFKKYRINDQKYSKLEWQNCIKEI